jgi:hypothetical protein
VTDGFPYLSKDGLWYASYEAMAKANKVHNEKYIASLGFDTMQKKTNTITPPKPKKKRRALSDLHPPEKRRSSRVSKKPAQFSAGLDDYTISLVDGGRHPRPGQRGTVATESPFKKNRSPLLYVQHRRRPTCYETLDETELGEMTMYFEHRADTIDDAQLCEEMYNFLITVPHGGGNKTVSMENARSTMTQVRKLVFREAITYHHWPDDVAFRWWKEISPGSSSYEGHIMTCNFRDVYNCAQEMEDTYGRDLGNGW